VRVLVVTAMYPTPERPFFGAFIRSQVEALTQAGLELDLLVLDGRFRKLIYPKGVLQLRQRLRAREIDLVHAHYGYVGLVARTQRSVPVVLSFCGDDLLGTVAPDGTTRPVSRVTAAAGRRVGESVDAVIVKSQAMAQRLKRRDVHVIPHGVDFEVFRPVPKETAREALGLHPSRPYVLFAAHPGNVVKRYPLADAAVRQLAAEHPSVELLAIHRETQERLALYMNAADVLAFPSYQEGSPNIVKQAMACNLPIVATDVGDVRDVIGQTKGCHVCDPEAGAFADRLAEELRRASRTSGRDQIRHLDRRVEAERVISVYRDVLESSSVVARSRRKHAATEGAT
jgi:glycosyltransferase involved in cell wall biosynthesis